MFLLTPIPQALLESQLLKRKAAGTSTATLAHPTGMLVLLRLQGLPPPGWARMKLKGLLRIYRVKETRRYHRNPSAATSTEESLVPPAAPTLHLAQTTHLQLTFCLYLCNSMCSSAAIPTASSCFRAGYGAPPSKGCRSATVASIQMVSSPQEGGWQLPNAPSTTAQHRSRLAPTTAPAKVTHMLLQLLKELFPMQEVGVSQNPGQKHP